VAPQLKKMKDIARRLGRKPVSREGRGGRHGGREGAGEMGTGGRWPYPRRKS
jgi:hypothetical protein